jgi:hypothetical protein
MTLQYLSIAPVTLETAKKSIFHYNVLRIIHDNKTLQTNVIAF